MIGFTYVCLLMVFIAFIIYLIRNNLKFSPKKIKSFFTIALVALGIRFLAMGVCILIEQQAITYAIKPMIFLNFFSIPLLALGCFYIFLRDDKRKFDYNFIFLGILIVAFIALIKFIPLGIHIKQYFGFIVTMEEPLIPSILYMVILASLCVITLYYLDKPFCNKVGMRMLLISVAIAIAELFIFLGGVRIYPYPLLGEAFLLISTLMAIGTFDKNSKMIILKK
ncbi:MAG: hypothetical protein RR486_07060 [Clostridium sp.]|uniref:hypothetical protein n=1 Tax=Clostridium sp. TaxID=1506 RepID=UPI0030630893